MPSSSRSSPRRTSSCSTSSRPARSCGSPSTRRRARHGRHRRRHPGDLPGPRRARPDRRQYTLEVSSPGLERPLRTPAHFAWAVGHAGHDQDRRRATAAGRRFAGTLTAATDDRRHRRPRRARRRRSLTLPLADIEKARTTFDVGPRAQAGRKPKPAKATRRATSPDVHDRPRRRRSSRDEHTRPDGGPPGAGRRQGHLGRHAVRRPRRRPRVGLQAAARRPGVRLGHHRPRHRRDPGHGPGARRGRRAHRRRSSTSPRRPTSWAASPPRRPSRS